MYLNEGEYFNSDGDLLDRRNQLIRKLHDELRDIYKKDDAEHDIREMNPAVKDAWDQYQTILRLVKQHD